MISSETLKPGILGAAAGAVALAIVGFSWGGWVTGGTAEKMASEHAEQEVVAALVPICVNQANNDPLNVVKITKLKEAKGYQRREILMESGWATMPGASNPDRGVASACSDKLSETF